MRSSSILSAPPTAELEPLTDGQVSQTDEVSRCPHYGVVKVKQAYCHYAVTWTTELLQTGKTNFPFSLSVWLENSL